MAADERICLQAAGQQAEVSRLQQCLAEERAATTRLALFEAEVGQLEFALAAEKASASDYRANLEAQARNDPDMPKGQ